MREAERAAIGEQIETLGAQFVNAQNAIKSGNLAKVEKSIAIIEKVARILLALLGAIKREKDAE